MKVICIYFAIAFTQAINLALVIKKIIESPNIYTAIVLTMCALIDFIFVGVIAVVPIKVRFRLEKIEEKEREHGES